MGRADGDEKASGADNAYESPFVEINERVDVGEALVELVNQLDRLPHYRYAWRWAAAALHAAVQAAIVISIAGSAKIGAMRPKAMAKWLDAYDDGRWSDLPDEQTDDFMPLYERMKEQLHYTPGEDVDLAVKRLHALRNRLGHIRPEALLVHPLFLIEMTQYCLPVVRYLLVERDDMWSIYPEERAVVVEQLNRADESISRLRVVYAAD